MMERFVLLGLAAWFVVVLGHGLYRAMREPKEVPPPSALTAHEPDPHGA